MNLPRFSTRRPVFATMGMLIVIVLGLVSLSRLQIDLLPEVELPVVSVRTGYPGASPEVMERTVTQFIEEIVATQPGVEEISSESSEGSSSVRLQFGFGTDVNTAALDVQAKLEDEINELPDDVVRPSVNKFDIGGFPVVILGIASDLSPVELTELVEDEVRYRFSRVPGVAQVDVWGGFNREIRVEIDPERIKALGMPLNEVLSSIRDANLDLPAGEIEQGRSNVTLRAPGEFTSVEQISDTVVSMREGAPVTLGQIADVKDTYEKVSRQIRINGRRGLRLGIRKQSDANTVEVARGVLEEVERINRELPQLEVIAVSNQGNFIERSIANVARSVAYGGLLAILVLLFFLRNLRSTFVIALAIPISIIATFALIYFGGLTINLMTLGGLALGVGMMVDNAIVVLENIYRRRDEENESPVDAAVNGAVEVGPAIIASTVTTLVIFLPLVFVRGVAGVLFQALGFVVVFALSASLAVALSLVPMLASKLIKPKTQSGPSTRVSKRIMAVSDRLFHDLDNGYRDLLRRALRHRWLVITGSLLLFGGSLLLVPLIGTEFMPPSDEGEVSVDAELEMGTRLELIDRQVRRMEEIVLPAVPEAISYVATAGGGWRGSGNRGEIQISLTPSAQRERSNTQIAADLREQLDGQIAGATIRTNAPQGQRFMERLLGGGDDGVQIEIRGYDFETLDLLASQAADAAREIEGVTDVELSNEAGVPQQEILVDRRKAADLGLSVRQVAEAIETAVAGSDAGDYRVGGNSYRILVQLADAEKLSLDEILDLTLRTPTGEDVALRNVITVEPGRGPTEINRKDQQRIVTVDANIAGRDLGSVARDIEAALRQIPRPQGYTLAVAGNFEEQQEAFQELLISIILAMVLVYMVLASQYESFRDPLIVMASVPTAAIGVLLILFFTGTTFNLQTYIGCIMLSGIVVNNAILLVDQAGQLRRYGGMSAYDAVAEAGRRRLRPILMTTLTTLLGLLPLALGIGEGADAQAPLARAVIGGLAASTLITLLLVPVVYTLFHPETMASRSSEPTSGDPEVAR